MSFYDTHKFLLWQVRLERGEILQTQDYYQYLIGECLAELKARMGQ